MFPAGLSDETLGVLLTDPANSRLGKAIGVGTIANDDTRRATAKRCTVPTLRGRTVAGAK